MTENEPIFETVIGLEVHAQLRTESKMFCRCSSAYADAPPNTFVCPVCQGMPGMLPVINELGVAWTIKTALALNMNVPEISKFDRKNYHYPDLMKGYQISQFDLPLGEHGYLDIDTGNGARRIGITRVHLEEDTARLLHRTNDKGESYSLLDVNRSGVALMEVVSEPDLRTPEEARSYLIELRQILRYLNVSNADMEKGSFRCDANISLRPSGSETLGTKIEVKNMNSLRAVYKALEYEEQRQANAIRTGEKLVQETRGWVETDEITVSQRSKEFAHDYRYFPEPDLPPIRTSSEQVEEIRAALPELPQNKRTRFQNQYGLGQFETNLLTDDIQRANYFELTVTACKDPSEKKNKMIANWIIGDLARILNETKEMFSAIKISPQQLAELVDLIENKTISSKIAKTVFETMYASGDDPMEIITKTGQTQISDEEELRTLINRIVVEQKRAVSDYQAGKMEAVKFLVGQIMQATRGRANPSEANRLLLEILESTSQTKSIE